MSMMYYLMLLWRRLKERTIFKKNLNFCQGFDKKESVTAIKRASHQIILFFWEKLSNSYDFKEAELFPTVCLLWCETVKK